MRPTRTMRSWRTRWPSVLAGGLAAVVVACGPRAPATLAIAPPPNAPAIVEIAMTVSDLDASTRFFVEGLEAVVAETRDVAGDDADAMTGSVGTGYRERALRLGSERVVLRQFSTPAGRPPRRDGRSHDSDFQHIAIVVGDLDAVTERVRQPDATPVSIGGPQRIPDTNPAAGGIRAFYFRDRDHRPLELIWYPPGRGDPRWQTSRRPAVLGIDHTAIAVASTSRSRDFYVGLLGLAVRGESLNEGPEQSALAGVEAARVRITGLGGRSGPGVELLEYEAPGPGRQMAARRPSDVGYWEITILVRHLDETVRAVLAAGLPAVSQRIAACHTCASGRRAFVVYDPDGHAVRVAGP